jgi:hypothetical protein
MFCSIQSFSGKKIELQFFEENVDIYADCEKIFEHEISGKLARSQKKEYLQDLLLNS